MNTARSRFRRWSGQDLALVATFTALLAAFSIVPAIPIGLIPVPITLQTLAVMVTGAILGPRRGSAAVVLYLLIGLLGAPIFAGGTGGPASFLLPDFGYLLAFPLAAAFIGWASRLSPRRFFARSSASNADSRVPSAWQISTLSIIASVGIIYPIGIAVMVWRTGLPLGPTIAANAVFLIGDSIKAVLTGIVAAPTLRAFPHLEPERSRKTAQQPTIDTAADARG